jgi:hypothetical protein
MSAPTELRVEQHGAQRYSFLTLPLSSATDADIRPRFGAGSPHRWQMGGGGCGGFEFRLVSAFGRAIIILLVLSACRTLKL